MQYIENKEITSESIEQIKKALNIETDKQFAQLFKLQKTSLSKYMSNTMELPNLLKLALFYVLQCIELEKTITELRAQLETVQPLDNKNDTRLKELEQQQTELQEQINLLETKLNEHIKTGTKY